MDRGLNETTCSSARPSRLAWLQGLSCEKPRAPSTNVHAARDAIAGWFAGEADFPDWPGFDLLAAARDYPARHGAILLPFRTLVAAIEQAK